MIKLLCLGCQYVKSNLFSITSYVKRNSVESLMILNQENLYGVGFYQESLSSLNI